MIDKKKYNKQVDAYGRDNKHWINAEERWDYHKKTGQLLKSIDFKSVLEVGTMGVKIWSGSDTIEFPVDKIWKMPDNPTFIHNLNNIHYPVGNKQYDVFIASRVFHHFRRNFIIESFKEWKRIANHLIIVMPTDFDMSFIPEKPTKIINCQAKTSIYYYETK